MNDQNEESNSGVVVTVVCIFTGVLLLACAFSAESLEINNKKILKSNSTSCECKYVATIQCQLTNTEIQFDQVKFEPVIEPKSCDTHPISLFINEGPLTSGQNVKRRQAIRNIWADNHNMSAYFVVGMNANQAVNQQLKNESHSFGDILQFGFNDSGHNLTLKSMATLRWIDSKCRNSVYMLKTHDLEVNKDIILRLVSPMKTHSNGGQNYLDKHQTDLKINKSSPNSVGFTEVSLPILALVIVIQSITMFILGALCMLYIKRDQNRKIYSLNA